jgi:hypothetical protein
VNQDIRGRAEMIFSGDYPAGGYEVLSKPLLGKWTENISIES